jgi:plasmid stabilization system protein ParE
LKVELSAEAEAQIERIDSWWRANRQAAPSLFADELEQALLALAESPALGVRYPPRPDVRRLLLILKRSHYHLYIVEQRSRVYVVAVWSAFRGRGPRL